jgi:hypothetical protein
MQQVVQQVARYPYFNQRPAVLAEKPAGIMGVAVPAGMQHQR